jgi:hypothetical protein
VTKSNSVLGTALAADVLSPLWVTKDDVGNQFRIDASDEDNPVYYLNGNEVSREIYFDAVWSGSMFRPDHLKKEKNPDA